MGIALPHSSARHDLRKRRPISKNMKSGGGYHVHDEGNEVGWKLEEVKRFLDKTPF